MQKKKNWTKNKTTVFTREMLQDCLLSSCKGNYNFLDEDIKAQRNTHEPIQVPVSSVTRAQAKRFKAELHNLVRRVLQQEESVFKD